MESHLLKELKTYKNHNKTNVFENFLTRLGSPTAINSGERDVTKFHHICS